MPELGSKVHVDITTKADNKGIDDAEKRFLGFSDKAIDASKKMTLGILAIGAGAVAFGVTAVAAYNEAQVAQKQLEHAVLNVSKATKEQLIETENLANALEKKGVLDGDNIKTGLAQLSTFGLSNKAVQGLGGSLADLAVNQFGVNASGEQMSQTANMIAKALNGQFGVLEKSGIRFNETQRAIIEFGTEQEKVAAINEGFAQNLKYTNAIATETAEGAIAKLNVQMGNAQEAIGKVISEAITPVILAFSKWIDKMGGADKIIGDIIEFIKDNTFAFKMLGVIILAIIVPAFVAWGIAAVSAAVGTFLALSPIILVIIAIAAILAIFSIAWNSNFMGIRDIVEKVTKWFTEVALPAIKGFFDGIANFIKGVLVLWKKVWTEIQKFFDGVMKAIGTIWNATWSGIKNFVIDIWNGIVGFIKNKVNEIINMINGMIRGFNGVSGKITGGKVTLGEIPKFANGVTDFAGGLAIVGERGPELVNLPRGSNVIPNGQSGGVVVNQYNTIREEVDLDVANRELGWRLSLT